MTDEARAEMQSQQGSTRTCQLNKYDVIGTRMGILVFVLGFLTHQAWWTGMSLLLISVGLLIPSRLYGRRHIRPVGYVALSLTGAVTGWCAVFVMRGILGIFSPTVDQQEQFGGMWWIIAALGIVMYLTASGLAISGSWLMLKKLKTRPAFASIAIAVGTVVGVLMHYLIWC